MGDDQQYRERGSRDTLTLYATPQHACSYLPGRNAVTAFVDPYRPLDNRLYSRLVELGFRRSGGYIYRPACPGCDACIPIRIPVAEFRPRRAERRTWRRNADLTVRPTTPAFRDEQFELYRRYMRHRHPGGEMDDPDPDKYIAFLTSGWSETIFYEFRLDGELVMVAVIDRLERALSAIYTFFEPELEDRSPGVHAVLWQIERARELGLPWVYLGYWIKECPKMRYKERFRPFEIYRNGDWLRRTG